MKSIVVDSTFFNIKDTLECGQLFRFTRQEDGFFVYSNCKCAKCFSSGDKTIVQCEDSDYDYFYNYFDLGRDYSSIVQDAKLFDIPVLTHATALGKGIRILNQDTIETLFSFIVSQNNNIPRIKKIIEGLCSNLGEKKTFLSHQYYTFPSVKKMASMPLEFYKSIGLGYRAEYVLDLAIKINEGLDILAYSSLDTNALKQSLVKLHGVGPKVADCVLLFGFHRSDSFPVDTWIEKVYRENFLGKESDRKKITAWFVDKFGDNAGYYQQYLFYYKRSQEKLDK